MDEPARWFYMLIKQAAKLENRENRNAAVMALLPHMERTAQKEILNNLERTEYDMLEEGSIDNKEAMAKLKQIFGEKPE